MKTNLEAWAFNFIAFGLVLPLVMGTLAHYHRTDRLIKEAKVSGCEEAKRHGAAKGWINCKELAND